MLRPEDKNKGMKMKKHFNPEMIELLTLKKKKIKIEHRIQRLESIMKRKSIPPKIFEKKIILRKASSVLVKD